MDGYDRDVFVELPLIHPAYTSEYDINDRHLRRSYVAKFLTQQVDKVVNLSSLKHHQSAGVTLSLKNMSHGLVNTDEREMLAVALGDADAIEASRVWQVLADALALSEWELRAAPPLGLHPTRSGVLLVAGDEVGAVGEVDPAVLDRFDIPGRVGWLELDLGRLLDLPHGERTYRKVSLYPSSDIDLAFEVDQAVPAYAVEATVRRSGAPLVVAADLFDVFRGGQIADGRRSLAFALRLAVHTTSSSPGRVSSPHATRPPPWSISPVRS
jgi:phenylalanyl-tRNA synthetase beta subunit